jgi:hypothetical protein
MVFADMVEKGKEVLDKRYGSLERAGLEVESILVAEIALSVVFPWKVLLVKPFYSIINDTDSPMIDMMGIN